MNKLSLLLLLLPATTLGQLRDDEDDDGPPPIPRLPPEGQEGAQGRTPPPVDPSGRYQYPPGQYPPPGQYQYPPGQYPPPGQGPKGQYQYPPGQYPQNQYPPGQNPPAQYAPGQYRYPTGQYQAGQYPPGQYQYPQGQYPRASYPSGQYPQNQYPNQYQNQYPNQYPNAYPPGSAPGRDAFGRPVAAPAAPAAPAQPPAPAQPSAPGQWPAPVAAAAPAKLVLTTTNEAARADALACADALENYHLDGARTHCAAALAKDPELALAHLWMAQAALTPAIARTELDRAGALAEKASPCERAFVEGWRAAREARTVAARRAYDQLVSLCGGERRAYIARGQLRQSGLGELEGAVEDYRKAVALDEKVGASENFLGFALADQGKLDEAEVALKKYAALSPSEPNAHDSLAALAVRRGDLAEALAEGHRALTLDPRFVVAHATLGDAFLLAGKAREARREYALLEAEDDAALRHDGAMRAARSMLWEDHTLDAERALVREADTARKAGRLDQAAAAFLEVVRIQVERGALAEAGRGIKEATLALRRPEGEAAGPSNFDEGERRRLGAELTAVRAMALSSIGERELGEARVEELAAQLRLAGDPRAEERVMGLRGWIAWRLGDDKAAVQLLEKASAPSLRFTYALSLARSGDATHGRAIMEELARRGGNDLDTALSRPRAAAWLKVPSPAAAK